MILSFYHSSSLYVLKDHSTVKLYNLIYYVKQSSIIVRACLDGYVIILDRQMIKTEDGIRKTGFEQVFHSLNFSFHTHKIKVRLSTSHRFCLN